METILSQIEELNKSQTVGDNLVVNKLIVNKDKGNKKELPFIATEKWVSQLGQRLLIN